jgi:hypothetical protein
LEETGVGVVALALTLLVFLAVIRSNGGVAVAGSVRSGEEPVDVIVGNEPLLLHIQQLESLRVRQREEVRVRQREEVRKSLRQSRT